MLRIEDFTNGAYATFIEMFVEAVEKRCEGRRIVGIGSSPRIEEGADKPCPYGSLMVGSIAGPEIAIVFFFVVIVSWRKRPQTDRRP